MKLVVWLLGWACLAAAGEQTPKAIFEAASQALRTADYAAAEQGFQAVLRREPDNVAAWGNLGIVYARTNRSDKAIESYRRALQLSPGDEPIVLNLGLVYLKQDLHERALPLFQQVLQLDPNNLQARQLLAVCQLYTGKVVEAIDALEGLRQAHVENDQLLFLLGFAYLKKGDEAQAKAVFQRMFETAGPAKAEFMFGRAEYEAVLFAQAEQSFEDAKKADPNLPGLAIALAKLHLSQRRMEQAKSELEDILKHDPNNEEAQYFLGGLLVQQGEYERGVGYLQRAQAVRPDSWAINYYLGLVKLKTHRLSEAIPFLRRAVELNPDVASAQYQLGRALEASGQKEEARQAFDHARKLKTDEQNEMTIPALR